MAGIVPNDGEMAALTALLGASGANVTTRLYKAAYTPVAGTVAASFVEADFAGYAAVAGGGWTAPAVDPTGIAYMVSPPFTWTKASGGITNDVYGLYCTVNLGGTDRVIYAENFPLPIAMASAGAQVNRQVTYTSRRAA